MLVKGGIASKQDLLKSKQNRIRVICQTVGSGEAKKHKQLLSHKFIACRLIAAQSLDANHASRMRQTGCKHISCFRV